MENSTIVELFFRKVVAELDFLEKVTKDLSILFRNSSQPTAPGEATTTTTTENPLVLDRYDDGDHHGSPVVAFIVFAIVIAVLFTVVISCCIIIDKIEKQNKSRQMRRQQSENVNAAAEATRNTPNADNLDPSLVLSVNLPPGVEGTLAISAPLPSPYEELPAYQNLFEVKREDKMEETMEENTKMSD